MRDRYEAALGRLRHDDRDLIIAKIEMGHSYKDMVSTAAAAGFVAVPCTFQAKAGM